MNGGKVPAAPGQNAVKDLAPQIVHQYRVKPFLAHIGRYIDPGGQHPIAQDPGHLPPHRGPVQGHHRIHQILFQHIRPSDQPIGQQRQHSGQQKAEFTFLNISQHHIRSFPLVP